MWPVKLCYIIQHLRNVDNEKVGSFNLELSWTESSGLPEVPNDAMDDVTISCFAFSRE